MIRSFFKLAALCAAYIFFCFATSFAHAQLLEQKTLSLESANKIMTGAIAEARANNWLVNIAVVDNAGQLLSFQRMDGAQYGSIDVAIGKARTAAQFRRPTRLWEESAKTRPAIVTLPHVVLLQGGVPVVVNGQTVGAIGVSGVTAQQDELIAEAGIKHAGFAQ